MEVITGPGQTLCLRWGLTFLNVKFKSQNVKGTYEPAEGLCDLPFDF